MRELSLVRLALILSLAASTVNAADFDGSQPLICATIQALDCVAGDECLDGEAVDVGAPVFMRIDFDKKVVIGPKRTTPIALMTDQAEQMLLQGHELGFGWTIAVNKTTGEMSASLVDRDGAYVLFGSCTPR
jgi:hypothetical protein